MQTRPWTVSVEGEVGKPRTFDIEELLKLAPMEERVYRLRCVEGWSMVIPWVGYSLSALLKQVEPTANAKYVEFVTVMQRDNMPGVRAGCWTGHMWKACASTKPCTRWPCWCSACTARSCPIRTGAFAAGGAVEVRLQIGQIAGQDPAGRKAAGVFLDQGRAAGYGFYANVNPAVPHPRWSQASERRIGEDGLFSPKRKTLPFNGYADQVAALYQGMDLKANY